MLFLAILLLAGLLLAGEKLLVPQNNTSYSGLKRYIRLKENPPQSYKSFIPAGEEPADNLEIKRYTIKIDAEGYVSPSKVHDIPENIIVFLGGSTTACYCVDEEKRFPYLAGRLLESQTGRRVNSYNSGVGGNDSLHSIDILVNKITPLKPDLAVMMHNINDLTVLLFENSYWSKNPSRSPIVEVKNTIHLKEVIPSLIPNTYNAAKKIEQTFRFWRDRLLGRQTASDKEKVKDEFQHIRGKHITIAQDDLLREFDLNLQTFVNICLAGQITPVLMTQANRLKDSPDPFIEETVAKIESQHGIRYLDYKNIYDLFNEQIRQVAARNQIPLIDLAKSIPRKNSSCTMSCISPISGQNLPPLSLPPN